MRRNFLNTFIFILFLLPAFTFAQKALIDVKSMVDTSEIYIGDRITYSIVVERDKNLRIEKPGEGLNLGMFEIKDYHFAEPVETENSIIERYDFQISVFDTGKFTRDVTVKLQTGLIKRGDYSVSPAWVLLF